MNWKEEYKRKLTTAEEVARAFKSGDVVSMCGGCNVPHKIAAAVAERAGEITDVTFCQGLVLQTPEYMKPDYKPHFRVESVFLSGLERMPGWVDPVPKHLGSVYQWLLDVHVNKATLMVSPPDENGYMVRSLYGGLLPKKVIDQCDYVAVEVNRHLPWIYSANNSFAIHVTDVDAIVENDLELPEVPDISVSPVEEKMAAIIADMIPDGSTIQLGLGGLANCIGYFLKEKKDLGIYTEVLSNSMMELVKCGAVNNSKKTIFRDKVLYTFGVGTRELFRYIERNPVFLADEIENVNNPARIAQNDNMVSVNNALMMDLTGQAASESIGPRQYSATGGQVNFVLGSQQAKNGKSIIALPSTRTDRDGRLQSRILDVFPPATTVTTSRNDVEWIVTEYGAVRLTSMSISKRVKALISIAHPDFRDELEFKARKFCWI